MRWVKAINWKVVAGVGVGAAAGAAGVPQPVIDVVKGWLGW